MEKLYIKSLDKEIEIESSWIEGNKIASKVLSDFLVDNSHALSIIDVEINDDGFIVDFEIEKNISENQIPLIEGKVTKLLSKDKETESQIPSSMVKKIKLRGVSGLTLEGKQGNRIFGFAALSNEEFETKLSEIEERDARDHRKIGIALDLFMFDDLAGKGMPIWLENGVQLKKQIKDYIYKAERKYGSRIVETPVIGSIELYKTSGHLEHYYETMFPTMVDKEKDEFILRPMACPHHILIYKGKPRSYRDLPYRIAEDVKMYRYEHSGALLGLERVRGMELTDCHIFLKEDQLKHELEKSLKMIQNTLKDFNIEVEYVELALHDPEDKVKYHTGAEMWERSEQTLREFLDDSGVKYIEKKGEAAFYGPKIDIQMKTALGHIITVSTIQVDFYLPGQFELEYTNSDNEKERPIMIHRGHIGTYERFISGLLEQTKGDLPMWLAPKQAIIFPINNEEHLGYAKELYNKMIEKDIRVKIDSSDDRLSNKVRLAQTSKVKTQIIIGDEEVKNNNVSYRNYGEEETHTVSIDELFDIYK